MAGVREDEIIVLPASAGQRSIIISAEALRTVTPDTNVRRKRIYFSVDVITRVRDIPNDRFGILYTDPDQAAAIHEAIVTQIESIAALETLQTLANEEKLSDVQVSNPAILIENRPPRWSIVRTFIHNYTRLSPTSLSPAFFLTKQTNVSVKIAGYKTRSAFTSPMFIENYSPLECRLFTP